MLQNRQHVQANGKFMEDLNGVIKLFICGAAGTTWYRMTIFPGVSIPAGISETGDRAGLASLAGLTGLGMPVWPVSAGRSGRSRQAGLAGLATA